MFDVLVDLLQNRIVLGCLFIGFLMISEALRYRQRMFYNDIKKFPEMQNHVLNKSFGLYKRPNLNYDRINKTLFTATTSAVVLGGLAIMINVWLGLAVYFLASSVLVFFANKKVLTLFPESK